jgi:hypothetical protein
LAKNLDGLFLMLLDHIVDLGVTGGAQLALDAIDIDHILFLLAAIIIAQGDA